MFGCNFEQHFNEICLYQIYQLALLYWNSKLRVQAPSFLLGSATQREKGLWAKVSAVYSRIKAQ